MKTTSEALRHVHILKLQTWDEKSPVNTAKKTSWPRKKEFATASTVYLFRTAPVLLSTATFANSAIAKIPLSRTDAYSLWNAQYAAESFEQLLRVHLQRNSDEGASSY